MCVCPPLVVRKHYTRALANESLIKPQFDVLNLTYRWCVED
ncbi:hypothetical protein PDIG_37560 [Penicillium digitatum PHI26]|uniref:Uncharacterized protein n=2 Tax=Penicillium digitatum TaxID=36651 RepID=K9FYD7_PEND2|nr:hypothetical protein PDIP_84150 [Penicillium digitatum Pd1]EKV05241.1 hypothetical protein PDIP_84150 [Penicillium digitatum Pd1]EKV13567.1 hypothetical protein PDIG_37560 [Penicillium digitatum PHI26]